MKKKQSKYTLVKLDVHFLVTVPKEQAEFYKKYEQTMIDALARELSCLLITKPFAEFKLSEQASNE